MQEIMLALCMAVFVGSMTMCLLQGKTAERFIFRQRLMQINLYTKKEDGNENRQEFFSRMIVSISDGIIKRVAFLLPINARMEENLQKQLVLAGSHFKPKEYAAITFITIVCCGILGPYVVSSFFPIQMPTILAVFLGVYTGIVCRRFAITSAITKRKQAIEGDLPNVIDLLSVSTTAGLGFDQALVYVTERCTGIFVDELRMAQQQLMMGKSKRDALEGMVDRCKVDEVATFVSAVLQAEEVGISMQNILNSQSQAIRQAHRQKVEEKAAKLPVKILLPIVLFIFPVLFIVLMGPVVPSLMEMM